MVRNCHCVFPTTRWASLSLAIALGVVCRSSAAESPQKAAPPETVASRLVQAALENELAGDNDQREALLREALDQSPRDPPAHWQLGQVRVRGKWQSPAEVERAAQQDKRLADYARRRDAAGADVANQIALAHWCGKNRLDDQQRVAWTTVMQLQPDNAEAIAALGVRPYRGMMLTPAEIEQFRARLHKISQAEDGWRRLVGQWLASIERSDSLMPDDFREKLCKTSDVYEMLGLQRALWRQVGAKGKKQASHRMFLAIAEALADNPSPTAAEALARGAVGSEYADVRSAAIAGLKHRPLDHYVPLLLSALQSPIQGKAEVTDVGESARRFSYLLYQEGALADLCFSADLLFNGTNESKAFDRLPFQMKRSLDTSVGQTNERIREGNARAIMALRHATDLDLGDDPMDWWGWWWQDYNEMYTIRTSAESADPLGTQSHKPVYALHREGRIDYRPPNYRPPCECFAPGTKVWTLTGRQAIEQIKSGDCVLAQDMQSGELAYKPVLAATVRQPTPRIRVGLGGESIVATPSHPFWVIGQGWRMTKQLGVGDRVHTPFGGATVESIEKLADDRTLHGLSYNLIVADFNDYFVGERGILVHDNSPRAPTAAALPGLALPAGVRL